MNDKITMHKLTQQKYKTSANAVIRVTR